MNYILGGNIVSQGEKITVSNGVLNVPNNPIIPFIEGDGTGPDIWNAASKVLEAAVEKAYKGEKKITWKEVYAGEKAYNKTGEWLPAKTLEDIREYFIAIKGPLTRQRTFDGDEVLSDVFQRFGRKPLTCFIISLFTGINFFPRDFFLAFICFFNSGFQYFRSGVPNIRACAVAFNKRDNRIIWYV